MKAISFVTARALSEQKVLINWDNLRASAFDLLAEILAL